jgi:urate oxidase
MAQLIIAQNKGVQSVTYALPNKHYIPVDMRYMGVENVKPSVNFSLFPFYPSNTTFNRNCSRV